MIYLCLARGQASGHNRLVRDNNPVGESVHPVLELSVTLQVGLHLAHFVQQLMGYLQRKRGAKNDWGEQKTLWFPAIGVFIKAKQGAARSPEL